MKNTCIPKHFCFVFTKAEKAGCSFNKQAQNLSEKLLCVHFYYLILVNSTCDTFTDWFPFYSLQCVKMTVHKKYKKSILTAIQYSTYCTPTTHKTQSHSQCLTHRHKQTNTALSIPPQHSHWQRYINSPFLSYHSTETLTNTYNSLFLNLTTAQRHQQTYTHQ